MNLSEMVWGKMATNQPRAPKGDPRGGQWVDTGRTSPGKLSGADRKIVSSIKAGSELGLDAFPKHLRAGLNLEVDLGETRGGHYSGGIITVGLPEGRRYGSGDMSYDMNGEPIANTGWFKWYDAHNQEYPTFSTHGETPRSPANVDVHKVLAQQTVQHEVGHAIHQRLEPADYVRVNKLLETAKISTRTTRVYAGYFDNRIHEGDFVPFKGYGERMNQERFSEVIRWKVSKNPRYDTLPQPLRTFINDLWSGKKKLRPRSPIAGLGDEKSLDDTASWCDGAGTHSGGGVAAMTLAEMMRGKMAANQPRAPKGTTLWLDLRWNLLRLKALAGVAATPKHLSGRHA